MRKCRTGTTLALQRYAAGAASLLYWSCTSTVLVLYYCCTAASTRSAPVVRGFGKALEGAGMGSGKALERLVRGPEGPCKAWNGIWEGSGGAGAGSGRAIEGLERGLEPE